MSRRTRRSPVYTPRHPQDVLHVAAVQGSVTPPHGPPASPPADSETVATAGDEPPELAPASSQPEPFGGKGDHDGNGAVGGAKKPQRLRERTLHELNLEARGIDRHHARKREEAQAAIREHVDPILRGVQGSRQVTRRLQKNLRPPVRE
jgi:hypothetical protein